MTEYIDIRFNTTGRCCKSNIFQGHKKCQFYAFGEVAMGADHMRYFLAPNVTRK